MGLWAKDYCVDIDDERLFFDEILQRVIQNPRFYLEMLDDERSLQSYKFSFINYHKSKKEKEADLKTFINKELPISNTDRSF